MLFYVIVHNLDSVVLEWPSWKPDTVVAVNLLLLLMILLSGEFIETKADFEVICRIKEIIKIRYTFKIKKTHTSGKNKFYTCNWNYNNML